MMIKNFLPKKLSKPVGRWSNDYCYTKTNKKIDFSNEDHCGPCGQNLLNKYKDTCKDTYKNNYKFKS